MDRKNFLSVILVFAIGIGVGALWVSGGNIVYAQTIPQRNVEQWEYTFGHRNTGTADNRRDANAWLRERGGDGWILVSTDFNWNSGMTTFWLKRRLP